MGKSVLPKLEECTDKEVAEAVFYPKRPHPQTGELSHVNVPPFTTSLDAIVKEILRNNFCYEISYSTKRAKGKRGSCEVWLAAYHPKIPVYFEIGDEAMALSRALINLMDILRKYDSRYKDKK